MDEPQKPKRLSIDEIHAMVTEIAKDSEAGADRFRALKMLSESSGATLALPDPMGEGEIVERVKRIMVGAGVRMTQIAYAEAFPAKKRGVLSSEPTSYSQATPEQRAEASIITSLPRLYQAFPESKRANGPPPGFPVGHSAAVKMEWCRQEALKRIVEREEQRRQDAHAAMMATDTDAGGRTDAPPS